MADEFISVRSANEAWVLAAARDYAKVLSNPDHEYSEELDAEENLMSAIRALAGEESGK